MSIVKCLLVVSYMAAILTGCATQDTKKSTLIYTEGEENKYISQIRKLQFTEQTWSITNNQNSNKCGLDVPISFTTWADEIIYDKVAAVVHDKYGYGYVKRQGHDAMVAIALKVGVNKELECEISSEVFVWPPNSGDFRNILHLKVPPSTTFPMPSQNNISNKDKQRIFMNHVTKTVVNSVYVLMDEFVRIRTQYNAKQ